jgi:D-aminopeptidase
MDQLQFCKKIRGRTTSNLAPIADNVDKKQVKYDAKSAADELKALNDKKGNIKFDKT